MLGKTTICCCAVAALLLTGCGSAPAEQPQAQAQSGGMGMGGAGASDTGMVTGVVAASVDAALDVNPDASSRGGVTITEVRAPDDGWVVVRSTVPPGAVLGRTWVPKGVSTYVTVGLTAADRADALVALHVDRGARKRFEFDPDKPERSPDKPVVVDRLPLESQTVLGSFGAEVEPNAALIGVEDQKVSNDLVVVEYLLLPKPSWIAVYESDDGLPGRRIGLVSRGAGELQNVEVPLEAKELPSDVVVAVHVDDAEAGAFEYDTSDPLGSSDQPYKSAGVIVAKRIALR